MLGAIILAVIIVILIPVSIAMTGGVVAAIIGWAFPHDGEADGS